jgi:hypothetical protein
VGDFTSEPWKVEIGCTYSEFFNAYTTTIPVIEGSSFKFIVDGEYVISSDHPTKYDPEAQAYNNIVMIFYYTFDSEIAKTIRRPLAN